VVERVEGFPFLLADPVVVTAHSVPHDRNRKLRIGASPVSTRMDDPVLLTGAGGGVGEAILERIGDAYEWKLMFHSPPVEEPDHEYLVGDVTDEGTSRRRSRGRCDHPPGGDPRKTAPGTRCCRTTSTAPRRCTRPPSRKTSRSSSTPPRTTPSAPSRLTSARPRCTVRTTTSCWTAPSSPTGEPLRRLKATGEILGRYYHDEHRDRGVQRPHR